jgi:xanthine dehydrogenase accessory factor
MGVEDIHHLLHVLQDDPQDSVLATIISVKGSAYRKEGATMLFQADGTQVGILSAGCLEADLAVRARDVWEQGAACTVVYDMRSEDDLSWGQGAGCIGEIQVLLEPVDEQLRVHVSNLKWWLDQGVKVSHAKKLRADGTVAEYVFLTEHGQAFGSWQDELSSVLESALLKEGWGGVLGAYADHDGFVSDADSAERVFVQRFLPKPRLMIFGAGPDAKPLAAIAAQCGWAVTVADWRPASCSRTHFPQATALVVGQPSDVLAEINLTPQDSVVIMTHNFQRDKELLRALLAKELQYLGMLGPRERTARLLEDANISARLRSPVGLSIGAVGAEEIAISILADVIQHRRLRAGNQVASP